MICGPHDTDPPPQFHHRFFGNRYSSMRNLTVSYPVLTVRVFFLQRHVDQSVANCMTSLLTYRCFLVSMSSELQSTKLLNYIAQVNDIILAYEGSHCSQTLMLHVGNTWHYLRNVGNLVYIHTIYPAETIHIELWGFHFDEKLNCYLLGYNRV